MQIACSKRKSIIKLWWSPSLFLMNGMQMCRWKWHQVTDQCANKQAPFFRVLPLRCRQLYLQQIYKISDRLFSSFLFSLSWAAKSCWIAPFYSCSCLDMINIWIKMRKSHPPHIVISLVYVVDKWMMLGICLRSFLVSCSSCRTYLACSVLDGKKRK